MAGQWAGGDQGPATPEEVDMFLSNFAIEPHAVQQLKNLDPYQQKAVIGRGSLSGARDPTAVVMSRCKKAMEGTMALSETVLVRGFDYGTTDDQLVNHMSSVGGVQNVKWLTDATVEVSYSSVDEAFLATQSLNQTTIMGQRRYIDVLPVDVGQTNWSQMKRPVAPGSTVLVRGFDFGTTQEQFESHMSSVGTITNVNMLDKGSAEVSFSNAMEASNAIQQLNRTVIPGNSRYIDVLKQQDPSPAKRGKTEGGGANMSAMMEMMKMMMQAMGGGSGGGPSLGSKGSSKGKKW